MARRDLAQHLEAILLRHLDIEKEDIGLMLPHHRYGLAAVAALSQDGDLGMIREHGAEQLARQRLIVGDKGGDGSLRDSDSCHTAACSPVAGRTGIVIVIIKPPSGISSIVKLCPAP